MHTRTVDSHGTHACMHTRYAHTHTSRVCSAGHLWQHCTALRSNGRTGERGCRVCAACMLWCVRAVPMREGRGGGGGSSFESERVRARARVCLREGVEAAATMSLQGTSPSLCAHAWHACVLACTCRVDATSMAGCGAHFLVRHQHLPRLSGTGLYRP